MNCPFLSAFLAFALVPALSTAQSDSTEIRQIWLKEVLINSSKPASTIDEHRANQEVIVNTDQVLNSLNGISIIKRGNYAWEPGIRGLSSGQISTTIDGMAVFGACTDKMDPVSSYIEPSNLSSIAISYGASEATSGNTIGGGFDFKIKQPILREESTFGGLAGSGFETNGNAFQAFSAIQFSSKKIGINLNGIYRRSGNYTAGGNKEIPFSQYEKWNGGLGMIYKISDHSHVVLNYIRDEGYNIGYPALTMDVLYAKANIASAEYRLYPKNSTLSKWTNKLYHNYIAHAMDDTKRPAEQVAMHMDMPGTSETFGYNSLAEWNFGKHGLSTEFRGYYNQLHAEMTMYPAEGAPMFMLTIPDAERLYGEMSIRPHFNFEGAWGLHGGVTMSLVNSALFSLEGQETIEGTLGKIPKRSDVLYSFFAQPIYEYNSNLSFFINTGYSMRAPTLQEMYGFYLFNIADGYDYIGNPALSAERSVNFSVGMQLEREFLKINSTAFIYVIDNYITALLEPEFDEMTLGASGVKQYQNIDGAVLHGIEVSATAGHAVLAFTTQNAYIYGTDNSGEALPNIPPFRSVNQLEINWRKIKFIPEVVVNAGQQHVSAVRYGESSTPASAVVNFTADRTFAMEKTKLSVNAGITNLLDHAYYSHTNVLKILNPGRSLYVRLSVHF